MLDFLRPSKGPAVLPETERAVATAMAAGAGYDAGAVTWAVGRGRRRKRSPNRAAIRALSRRRRRWLRKHGRAHPDLAAVGALIAACGRRRLRHRCRHPACPRCAHALQRLFVRAVHRLVVCGPGEVWSTVSIILPALDPDGVIDFGAERARYTALLREAGIVRGVFGLDLSFNEDHRGSRPAAERFPDHASVHLYGLAPAAEAGAAKAALKRLLPATDMVPRPVRTKPWDGGLGAIAYMAKPEFQRRQTIEKVDPQRGKLVRDTRDRPLTVEQQIQAVRALARAGLTGRFILLGLQLEAVVSGPADSELRT